MNNTFSVYHFVLFLNLTVKIEGKLSTGALGWITSLFFRCPGIRCLEWSIGRNELNIAK